RSGKVNQVEINVTDVELRKASLECSLDVEKIRGPQFGRNKDFFTRNPAGADRPPDARFVAGQFGGIDQAVSRVERPPNRVLGFRSLAHGPNTEPEHSHNYAVPASNRWSEQ